MKKFLFLFTFPIVLCSCRTPNDNNEELTQGNEELIHNNKELIQTVKDNSIYSDSLDWNLIEKEIAALPSDQYSVTVNYLIRKLEAVGDFHTLYIPKNDANKMAKQNLFNFQPEAKYLGDNIAYIKVPGFLSSNEIACENFAIKIQTLIKSMDTNSINGWIVDLRENKGGNMQPMITGLGPLTGEGTLGYFVYKSESYPWSYKNGAYNDLHVPNPYTIKNKNARIAVLINNRTASSGEFTAISFIGKNNTKLFGQPSAGYTSANEGYELSDSSYLYLATSFTADRSGKKYSAKIIPDIIIDSTFADDCIRVATQWLKGEIKMRP